MRKLRAPGAFGGAGAKAPRVPTLFALMKRLLVLALAAAAAGPGGADAAQYTQYACRADGSPAPADGVSFSASGAVFSDNCVVDGTMTAGLSAKTPSSFVEMRYSAPSNTSLASVGLDRTLTSVGSGTSSTYEFLGTTDRCRPSDSCDTSLTYDWGGPLDKMTLSLSCPSSGCTGSATPQLSVTGFRFRLEDSLPPVISSTTGFLAGGDVSGVASASFAATDQGGGVFQQELVVDDVGQGRTVVDDNGGTCHLPFVVQVPCKLAAVGTASLDTTRLLNGDHTVALRVHDATLDNVTTYGPVTVHVRNDQGATGLGGSASQVAGTHVVPRSTAKVIRRPFDKPSVLHGRLLDAAGAPVAGAEVGAYAAPDVPGAKPRLVATAVTGPAGGYRLVLPAGPSRRVTIRPTQGDGSGGWSFRTRVRAPIRLLPSRRHLRNGDKLMLTAYLAGAKPPARSADVAFQVLIGTQWRTFARRTLDGRGLAQVGHRFHVTFHRMTYRFRALTLRRRNLPFDDAHSPTVAVRVN
jgi:hypothetical protein